jgi:hypothetical protein
MKNYLALVFLVITSPSLYSMQPAQREQASVQHPCISKVFPNLVDAAWILDPAFPATLKQRGREYEQCFRALNQEERRKEQINHVKSKEEPHGYSLHVPPNSCRGAALLLCTKRNTGGFDIAQKCVETYVVDGVEHQRKMPGAYFMALENLYCLQKKNQPWW